MREIDKETAKKIYHLALVIASSANDIGFCKATGKECATQTAKNNDAFAELRRIIGHR